VLDNDGVYSLLFEDKDVTKNSYLNGRYELTYNSNNLSLFGHYENYSTGKRSDVRLYKGEPDNMEVEEKPAERAEQPKSEVDAYKEANQNFLKENKTKDGVRTTSSGLQYKVITNGSGPKPGANDKVKITYKSYLIDGTMTDSAEGLVFEANKVIKGLQEALCMMPVGSKWEVYIPSDLAFGPKGAGKIKPNSVMIFVIELLDVIGAGNTASETPNQAEQSATETTSSSNGTGFRLETGSADTGADNNIYDNVDVQPEFPGGSQALNAYLGNNVKYPSAAVERGAQGKVVVSFVVERDGSISQARVVRAVDQDLDREALRVILAMPRWKPGSMGGKNVRVRYELPITFRLK
jgi:FKBP-type peptidyl-prolyl cis-trans isomerase FklB